MLLIGMPPPALPIIPGFMVVVEPAVAYYLSNNFVSAGKLFVGEELSPSSLTALMVWECNGILLTVITLVSEPT